MQKNKQTTIKNNQSSPSEEQEFKKRYQDWLEKEMLRHDDGAFY